MNLHRLSVAAILLTLLAAVFIEANAEPLGRIFWHLLTVYDLPAAWWMTAILVFGYLFGMLPLEVGSGVDKLLLALDRQRWVVAIGLWAVLCIASIGVYRNQPLSMDEYAAVFQARIFAAGALHGNFPPDLLDNLIPRGFQNQFLMVNRQTGAVFSAYWPGFSLLLTPFVWLGIPWACNPTLVAASLLLIARIARDLIESPQAPGWALLLALASPAFVANGITYYSMPAHLLLNLTFAWLLLVPTRSRLLLAGLTGGFALALHNPFPHVAFAAPWIVWLMMRRGERLRCLGWLLAGYLIIGVPLVAGWSLWQRDVLSAGAAVATAIAPTEGLAPGFGERAVEVVRGFLRVLQMPGERIVYARLGGLTKLWLWASPMLLLLAWWGGRKAKSDGIRLLGASALTTFFAYFLIWFDQGHGWGYRYFHSAWGVLPILGAAGALKLVSILGEEVRWRRTLAAVTLASLVAANSLRFFQMGNFMSDHLAQSPPRAATGFELVVHNDRGYYGKDLIQNDPWLRGSPVIVVARNEAEQKMLLDRFRDRFSSSPNALSNRFGTSFVGN